MAKGFSSIKPRVGNNNRVRIDEQVEVFPFPNKKWVTLRFLENNVLPIALHWLDIIGPKSKEKVTITKHCVGFDMETEDHNPDNCPYCAIGNRISVSYYLNAIIRSIQEDEPRKKAKLTEEEKRTGFKEKDSDSWTPVRVVRIPSSLAQKLQGLRDLNVHKDEKGNKRTYDITDPVYGADVNIKYDKDAPGADKYQVQLADKVPLTEEEQSLLVWNLTPDLVYVESYEEAKKRLKAMDILDSEGNHISFSDDDDDEVEEAPVKSKKSASKKTSKLKVEDEDEDYDFTDDDDDDEEEVSSKSKKPAKAKAKIEDDDELDLDLDDDEDEDFSAKKKAKTSSKPKAKAKVEDEDEDFDLDDDEDEEEVVSKSKKPAKTKSKSEDEDEDFDLDEDEDEEVVSKSKKPAKAKAKVEDDDDEDFDLDDDEDEEEVSKPKKSSKAKAKVEDDDDEDFDLDEDEEESPPPKTKKPVKTKSKSKSKSNEDEDDIDF